MNSRKLLDATVEYMYKTCSKDRGAVLIAMGIIGWVSGGIAQMLGVALNNKIDKKQKGFLLKQEGADAAVNIGLFVTICPFFKWLGDHIVEKGKFLTDDVAKAICNIAPTRNLPIKKWANIFAGSGAGKNISELLSNPKTLEVIKKAPVAQQEAMIRNAKFALEAFKKHKNNVGVVTSIGASVLACNIITPIVRNYVAAKMEKHQQHKNDVNIRKTQIRENITMKNPLPTSFKAFNNYNSFSGIKI